MSILLNEEKISMLEKINSGKCADIYKNGEEVYKIIKQKSDSRAFYNKESLKQLTGIKSNLCVFPNEILESHKGELLGYSMDFVPGSKLKNVINELSFEQLQDAIIAAQSDISELSNQKIMFEDMHYDNIMWNTEKQKIQIIDTDFFKRLPNVSDINGINSKKFSEAIRNMIEPIIYKYGKTENEQLIPFYDTNSWLFKDEKQVSLTEYIVNLRDTFEKDFGYKFNNLLEIESSLKQKQEEIEENQYKEQIANNLTLKEKIIKYVVKNKYLNKLPFVNKLIDKQVKKLPPVVKEIICESKPNKESKNFKMKIQLVMKEIYS